MASFSSLRAILPAAHSGSGVPSAALKAAATTGASFLVVCPAGARADAVVAAIQAATKGTALVLSSSRVVACAAKRSGGLEDGRNGEDADEVDDDSDYFIGAGDDCTGEEDTKDDSKAIYFGASEDDSKAFYFGASDTEDDTKAFYFGASDSEGVTKDDTKAFGGVDGTRTGEDAQEVDHDSVYFIGAGEDRDRTGEEVTKDDSKAIYFIGAGDDRTGEEVTKDDSKAIYFGASEEDTEDDSKAIYFGANEEVTKDDVKAFGAGDRTRTGNDLNRNDVVVFGSGEMTMPELVVMFHKETARSLKQVKHFPVGNAETSLASLMASCDAVGEQIHKSAQILDSPEGRPIVHSLIALHLRIASCAGRARIHKRGSSVPDMWSGDRHRLPCKEKRDGTLMELLLYSMMLADAALGPFNGAVDWDFTAYD